MALRSLMGFITLVVFSSLVAIEVVASRQYAAAWFPELTKAGSSDPTTLGWFVQFGLLCLFFLLNYRKRSRCDSTAPSQRPVTA